MSDDRLQTNDTGAPLVSCLMPTHNRRRFVGQAIRYFLRQDYQSKELIVLDDGDDSVADLIPDDERIRYVRLDDRMPLGAKRNLGCCMSRGELIAHWDDDDWMAPDRLSRQVCELLRCEADICGTRELLHYSIRAGEAWLYRYPAGERSWLAGGTLLYRRSVWDAHPFPEINVGEDNAFVWQHPAERICAMADSSFYVALIHNANTSAKRLRDARWQRGSMDDVSRLLAADREFYVALRQGGARSRGGGAQSPAAYLPADVHARSHRPDESLANCLKAANDLPLVSCIMPTCNRRAFLPRAIEYFRRQDYPRRELIVVDDGSESCADLIPPDAAIRYLRIPRKQSIGAKRNHACAAAKGEIIILWDDDDWYSPERISYQVLPLLEGRADITSFTNSLLYDLPRGEFWACADQLHARMFYEGVVGGTLAFSRSLWNEQSRFPDISEREDAGLLEIMLARGARLEKLTNDGAFIYIRHAANTWQFTPGSFVDYTGWRRVATPSFLPAEDCEFYGVAAHPSAPASVSRAASLPQASAPHAQTQTSTPDVPQPPLVSCILATGNRLSFVPQAIRCFLNQTYERRELIIVDDGAEPAEALIPADERIRYVRLETRTNLGRKLNMGIERSSGEIIQRLDDDDYYHPGFLEATVNTLVGHDPEGSIVGFDCFLVLLAATGELKFSGHGWCADSTLCFYRRLWEKAPFRDLPRGADRWFLADHEPRRITVRDPELFIHVRHQGAHLWTHLGEHDVTEYFQRQPSYSKSLAECLAAEDREFYERLRRGSAAAMPEGSNDLSVAGTANESNGRSL